MVKMNRISYTYKSIQQKQKTRKKKNTNNIYNQNFAEIERKKERSIEIKKIPSYRSACSASLAK